MNRVPISVKYIESYCAWEVKASAVHSIENPAFIKLYPCETEHMSRANLPLSIQQLMAVVDLIPIRADVTEGIGGRTTSGNFYSLFVTGEQYEEVINEHIR